ncbi:hypothetical protein ACWGJT_16770 [Streptomyces xantholiticus]
MQFVSRVLLTSIADINVGGQQKSGAAMGGHVVQGSEAALRGARSNL